MIIRTCHKINISFSDDNIEYCKVNVKLTNIKIKNQSFFITLHIDSKAIINQYNILQNYNYHGIYVARRLRQARG